MKILVFIICFVFSSQVVFSQEKNIEAERTIDYENPFHGYTSKIKFKPGVTDLLENYNEEFKQIIFLMNAFNEDGSFVFEISGHTDSVGSKERNQILPQKRADKIKEVLVLKGCDASKLRSIGCEEERPIGTNKTREGRFLNRRFEIKAISN